MKKQHLPVPAVVRYVAHRDHEFLLTAEVPGTPASALEWRSRQADLAVALGTFLARLHSTDCAGCPFDRRISVQLDEARLRIATGDVREGDFDAMRQGRTAADLYAELLTIVPESEDLVFVHGDFTLPNILLSEQASGALTVAGLIDCGRAGIGDRHQDLALAIRSLTGNFGPGAVAPFIAAYGHHSSDLRAVEFFTILDEFF
jgi:aminoglycoside phosphotransferase